MRQHVRPWLGLCITAVALAACAGGKEPARPGADGGRLCSSDIDCNDAIDCTVDSCGAGNVCRNMPLDDLCAAGETCSTTRGCTTSTDCAGDSDCNDGIDCTVDSCNVDMTCRFMPVNGLCEAGETCDAAMGCVAGSGCATDADCDDSIECTNDSCGVDMTCRNMPIDALCADGERCNETSGCYMPMPCTTADDCQDGDFCNGAEVCMPEFGCAPAPMPRSCTDTDPCTLETCDTDANMCVYPCDTSNPECDCPTMGPTCIGTFDLTPGVTYSCAIGMVNFDFSRATFAIDSGVLTISAGSATFPPLTDAMAPICPSFDASSVVSGGCEEHYRLYGDFTDDNTFTGTLEVRFVDVDGFSCGLGGCVGRTTMVTGTRM